MGQALCYAPVTLERPRQVPSRYVQSSREPGVVSALFGEVLVNQLETTRTQ